MDLVITYWTLVPARVRFHIPWWKNFLQPEGDSRSADKTVQISSHSATTSGSSILPPAWMSASVLIACSVRPTLANQRGDRGKNGKPSIRRTAGMNWMPQAVRNDAVPAINEQP